jgi:hypothetical protein
MSNVLSYHDAWADLRRAVGVARADYLRRVEKATPYLPSEKAKEDIEAARTDYEAALEAARAIARPKFARVVKAMKEHVGKPDMTAPTQDMIATLTMLDMRDSIDSGEVEAACKLMGGNSAALATLAQVVTRHGGVMPIGFKTPEAQAQEAVERLQRAANNLLLWDGRTSTEISSDVSRARHDYLWAGGAPVPENARAAQWVADIDAASTYRATVQNVIGDGVSMSVVDMLG